MTDGTTRDEPESLQVDADERGASVAETPDPISKQSALSPDPAFDVFLRDVASTSALYGVRLPAVGEVIAGRYRIEERLGGGGMGAVFRATHLISEKQVAVKWMLRPASDDQTRRRFLREARAAARIDHPNVVDVYDAGQQGDLGLYMVMQLLRGETLGTRIKGGVLAPEEAVELLLPAMRGVSAVHRAGIIHRDLKPENIFLCEDKNTRTIQAKVLDFGISAMAACDPNDPTLTRDGAALGTPAYMSPEQLRDARKVDARTDVYAFGVILYEAFTGRLPFAAESYNGLILEIVHGTPRKLRELRPDLPAGLEQVVLRAFARRVEDRFATIDELIVALQPYRGARRASSESRVPMRGAASTDRRARGSVWLALGALLVLLAVASWGVQRYVLSDSSSGAIRVPVPPLPAPTARAELAPVRSEGVSPPVATTEPAIEPVTAPRPPAPSSPGERPRQGRFAKSRRIEARSGTISADEL
ncbi:MAG TPA: serine/threonine-protein kinase, partial [Polyangiales bacterium]|nr:serine/threonine-protein kinase [Polyangiales bacterium]